MARYGRDYGWQQGGGYYGQGGGYRGRGEYDRGYRHGWGMEGLYDSITGGAGERGYGRDYRGGSRYDRDFYRRDYGSDRPRTPFGGMNPGGRSRFGAQRGYDRSFGGPRIDRSRYDRGWF